MDVELTESPAPQQAEKPRRRFRSLWAPFWMVPISFFLVELFGFAFLSTQIDGWPLAFGALWALLLTGLLALLPPLASRIVYGCLYFLSVLYAGVQTGYFLLFREMMWLSDFRYASEGADYFSVLLDYPLTWWLFLAALVVAGILLLWKYPRWQWRWQRAVVGGLVAVAGICGAVFLPLAVFQADSQVLYAETDYARAQSAQAAYENMFNAHRLYRVCGLYQTAAKDLYTHFLYPLSPWYASSQEAARTDIDAYFAQRPAPVENDMTGVFMGKNVVLVLMESMDDWAIGEHTPTICRLMDEGINFTNFYTPPYGGVRTFNSEFCANTGVFLSSQGGYAFDYVTNAYSQSLASRLSALGYSAMTYHYNSPSFYSRGVFEPAMGYDAYVSYMDYTDDASSEEMCDDQFLFNCPQVADSFFREGPKLNFIITRAAHLGYRYNEIITYYGLKKYPQYRGLTGNEEEDSMYLKARLVDDMFARLLEELEAHGELENTVIVAFTDHYTYGVEDQSLVLERSGVTDPLLVEKTPCFIWSADGSPIRVDKTLSIVDLLPTVLNLLGIPEEYSYLGQDAFDPRYPGYALFSDGSWVSQGVAYNAKSGQLLPLADAPAAGDMDALQAQMSGLVSEFVRINNLILDTDYYRRP